MKELRLARQNGRIITPIWYERTTIEPALRSLIHRFFSLLHSSFLSSSH
jgi:hypothetical protein